MADRPAAGAPGVDESASEASTPPPPLSHADRHDLDKLKRWHDGLREPQSADAPGGGFPVCAAFLVTGEDRAAHDIFRCYRAAFEELGGQFQHLVIFGQHGLSGTAAAMLAGSGLDGLGLELPLLLLAPADAGAEAPLFALPLPPGTHDELPAHCREWETALAQIRHSADSGEPADFGPIPGVRRLTLPQSSLAQWAGALITQLDVPADDV